MDEMTTREQADQVLDGGAALLFKHNTTCPISANAHREMDAFLAEGAGMPVYRVDIHAARDVSGYIAERTGVEHQSPQVIVVRGGKAAWSAALFDITADALREHVGSAGATG
ncbi:MAG TPA: bacillithiol system redox-active protein YtxJ [Longimicrobium sp.]|nr:bacillithiol system redox-active protein YtxJ [Longimicrobium sp.]